jgi:hypothetical protein
MRGKRAKQIRKLVYGDFSPRFREYRRSKGGIVADDRRRRYQMIKRNMKEWLTELRG